jgi:hypothetical protein
LPETVSSRRFKYQPPKTIPLEVTSKRAMRKRLRIRSLDFFKQELQKRIYFGPDRTQKQ